MLEVRRGDVVLLAFPFIAEGQVQRKRRPALVIQSDRYNPRRAAVIIAAITSTRRHSDLPCKVRVSKRSREGREAGLLLDSVVDCQTIATVPRDEIVARLGRFPAGTMDRVDRGLRDALALVQSSTGT